MSGNQQRVRDLIAQEAADWFVANRASLTGRERHNFAAWLKASPVHVEEYLLISGVARDLHVACETAESSLESLLARARLENDTPVESIWSRIVTGVREFPSRRWQTAAVTMAAFVVLSFGLLAWWNLRPAPHAAAPTSMTVLHFETHHGEQQTHLLADNSVLHLNSDSSVTVRYSPTERLVRLFSGEAAFEVRHAADRPFRVFAGSAEVVDVGTQFDVRLEENSTVVTVVEGLVAVAPSNQSRPTQSVQLGADQQMTVREAEWPATVVPVDAERSTAWLHRQISFEHEPLARVVTEFNRYASKPIEITTPALKKLQISGVFSIDDTDAFVAFLRSLEGVHVEVTDTQIRVSQD
jgi:transmembrane sensor